MPDPALHEERFGRPWEAGDTANAAIGQRVISATPSPMAGLIAAVGNSGRYFPPQLILDEEGVKPTVPRDHGIAAESLELVRAALWATVNGENAVGVADRVGKVEIAGKTGTAQWGERSGRLAWFVGYSPAQNPRHAISLIVEDGQSGGRVAALLAGIILAVCAALPAKLKVGSIRPRRLDVAEGHQDPIETIDANLRPEPARKQNSGAYNRCTAL